MIASFTGWLLSHRPLSGAGIGTRVTSFLLGAGCVSLRTSQYPSAGLSDPQVPLLSLVMLGSLTGKRRPILAETRQTGSAKG